MPRFKKNVCFAAANHNKLPEQLPVPFSQLTSLVDPSAFVSRTTVLGKGCVIYLGCFIAYENVADPRDGDMTVKTKN